MKEFYPTTVKLTIVVPCYNESKRIRVDEIIEFIAESDVNIIFVDDGSTDNTLARLTGIKDKAPNNIMVVSNPKNIGKGNAVRAGVLLALQDKSCAYMGYFDADLSTPLHEALRMMRIAIAENKGFIVGSRVALFGYNIKRNPIRHYLGRVVATMISLYLDVQIYDTQCGAKVFARDIADRVFERAFLSRWLFDVEILRRIQIDKGGLDQIVKEVPLKVWVEKGESKLGLLDLIKVPIDLFSIMINYRRV
jgi:glycosyltransferase involved in cell wall biosynthesis